ncbi:MAG TPA: sigma 54-interacting transcriptional regulator [Gemmatimonadales bacterium]|nr:sigma 54-interacting transcriptional regulator [Gemmatimonadales bacterium]
MSSPRKIVFNVPSLLPDAGRARVADPAAGEVAPAAEAGPDAEGGEDARKLAMLVEVSQALTGTLNLQAGLYGVLEVLERRCGALRGAITLLEEASGMLVVEAALGYPRPSGRVRYRIGEGVTGMVAQSGTPAVVPRVSREPRFLHRAAERAQRGGEITFICVPIALDGGTAGTLAIEQRYVPERDGDRTVSALRITAGMIAQALRIQRLIDAERRQLVEENTQLRQELREHYDFTHLIGNSGPMRRVFEEVGQVVGTTATVLIRGESGTGKELIAHALHQHSPRAGKPFVRVNCAALPETLVESELFGYERGAFTGAQARRKGRFELADGGTLFLDEIGELSPSTQARLLRVVQEREFERLGGTSTIGVDVRLITATNKDLERAQLEGTFREDLYYRLNVFTIWVPPLRERKSDILLLADHFVEKYARLHGRSIKRISTPAIDMLVSYHWPGNVRELENTIERAILVADGDVIHGHHLSPTLQTAEASGTVVSGSLGEAVAAFEGNLIQDALKTTRGNRARAARLLSTTERIINYKIRRYGIDPRRFRG